MPNRPTISRRAQSAIELRVVNDMAELVRAADLVEKFGAEHNLPNNVIVAVSVSLDEILNNIISYAYEGGGRHEILVRLELRHGDVEIVVEDDGKPFDPLAVVAPRPSVEPSAGSGALGGVGLHFVRSLMSELEYTRRGGINRLRLVKKLTE